MKTKQKQSASRLTAVAEEKRDVLVKRATAAAKEIKEKVETSVEDLSEKIRDKYKESEEKLEDFSKKIGVKSTFNKISHKVSELAKGK